MAMNLTRNAIAAIDAGDVNGKPLLQVLEIEVVASAQERYVLLLSDSVDTQQAILATQLNDRIKNGHVRHGSVVQLIDYICTILNNRKIIVVLNMETIIAECSPIGTPSYGVHKTVQDTTPFNNKNGKLISGIPTNPISTFRPVVQSVYQPTTAYKSNSSIVKNEAPPSITPIAKLNPYQGRWSIRARVTAKSVLRRYNNAKGDGKVFFFDLLDSDDGEITATCFNSAVDHFFDIITVGNVYMLSKGTLKPTQKSFNHLNNDWEIFLDSTSVVELQKVEDKSIPMHKFSFRTVAELEILNTDSIVDIIAIVTSINASVPVLKKNRLETQRRTMTLTDGSGRSIKLTMWGDFCNREGQQLQELVDSGTHPILAVKSGKINYFSGNFIVTTSATQLFINPDLKEAKYLRGWFDQEGKFNLPRSLCVAVMKTYVRKTVSQIEEEGLGRSDKPDWVTLNATLTLIKTDKFCYTACPLMVGDRECIRKVVREGDRGWRCDRCNKWLKECNYRYIIQAKVQDHTGVTWVRAFQEAGEEIVGCSAKELYFFQHFEEEETKYRETISNLLFTRFLFRLRVKEEMYGGEQRVRVTVMKAQRVDYSKESRLLLEK